MAQERGNPVANEAGKVKKVYGYTPDPEARKRMDEKGRPEYDGDGKHFVNVKESPDVPQYFRLVPWSCTPDVIAQFGGGIYYLTVNKYGFRHPCRTKKNDSTQKVWFGHVSEPSFDPDAEDTVYNYLKERFEDENFKAKLSNVFSSEYRKVKEPKDCISTEYWILVQPMQAALEEEIVGGRKVKYSIPVGKPKILPANWTIIKRLFGSPKEAGLEQDPEIGTSLWSNEDGTDFSITYNKASKSYTINARRSVSTVEEDSPYLEENQPPVLDLLEKGVKGKEAIHLLDVFIGEDVCTEEDYGDDAPAEEEEKQEVADNARTTTRHRTAATEPEKEVAAVKTTETPRTRRRIET